ncbi:hypothetical protein SBC1_28760 [Caballeronia sp. SBC1]|nr:hypothetical protein SBC1_28760 [Caballeronia sp. SBC1]
MSWQIKSALTYMIRCAYSGKISEASETMATQVADARSRYRDRGSIWHTQTGFVTTGRNANGLVARDKNFSLRHPHVSVPG